MEMGNMFRIFFSVDWPYKLKQLVILVHADSQNSIEDFHGGPVVGNLPANAGDMGSVSGSGRFPIQLESSPHLPQLQKTRTQQQRPSTAKDKYIKVKFETF